MFILKIVFSFSMASKEHISLSDLIKSTHENLRKEALILGAEEAWNQHCLNEGNLKEYATAMKELASNHWENSYKKDFKAVSRVKWVVEACNEYFLNIGKFRDKEIRIASKINVSINKNIKLCISDRKWKLFDVGSCYNPFQDFDDSFDVTAIDIAPACPDVLKCDFLNIVIQNEAKQSDETGFTREFFDIIVFSLLLEYLPSPEQRYKCCENAYNLLRTEGILVIITPDSKHVGANAKLMKSWRSVLSQMGFSRTRYEKLTYIHCMVFRKALSKEITRRWADLHHTQDLFDKIHIPQDFKTRTVQSETNLHEETFNERTSNIDMSDFLEEFAFSDTLV